MSLLTTLRARFGRRLGWRLLAVFIVAALVPLAASDWIATTVVADVAQGLSRDRDAVAARAASRQVFDRLLLSAALLRAVDEARDTARQRLRHDAVGPEAPFASLDCDDPTDTPAWQALASRWQAAAGPAPARAGRTATLRLETHVDGRGALLMAPAAAASPHCIGVLNPALVWAPLSESRDDGAWRVQSEDGRAVYAVQGADAADVRGAATDRFAAHLFLVAEFGAANWTFEQTAPRATGRWHGMPIAVWLLSVAAATLLLIGLAVSRTIGRTLKPLAVLDAGARRLAAGIESTRVDVQRRDELGRLADSFNDMAAQLQERQAAARALAAIDEGILAHAPFAELAARACGRLGGALPTARIVVAWRDDDGLHALRGDAPAAPALAASPAALQQFDAVADGPFTPDSCVDLAAALALDTSVPWHAWAARDAGRNRALILVGGPADGSEPAALRDRLTVAVVARDRERQLQQRATHDLLTGLRNTWGLQLALAPLLEADAPLAVLFVDLDHFKDVNDCYGHAVGDRLLQSAARRLERAAPAGALLSRNGGDEFVVIVPGAGRAEASTAAAALLDSLGQPFILSTTEHRSSASIGIALFPQHGLDRDDLLRCADIALYEAKDAGRGRATVFELAFDARRRERNDLLAGLDRGLRRDEFVLHYQPRFHAATGAFASAEALVRWQHPERGLLLPGVFIDLAETSGLIDTLGQAVMAKAIEQLGQWRRAGLAVGRLSVNVSQRQFEHGTLVPLVRELLARHEAPGHLLEIEVTESVLGGDVDSVRRQLHELRTLGATVAMDDFGTGYSSLAQLRTLPIDVMKIDRAFVKDLEDAPDAVAIARTIVTLARALGLRIVAEGIETPAQAALLREMGCDEFQGFLFAKALPPAELGALAAAAPQPAAP